MYQVITQVYVNGTRQQDEVFNKIYKRLNWARRQATEKTETTSADGRKIEFRSYVRGVLNPVSREEAKSAYVKCKRIWIDNEFGQVKIPNSWEYGSHAPAEELFGRSVSKCGGYWDNGNFYIEDED